MRIDFPYGDVESLEIPERHRPQRFTFPDFRPPLTGLDVVKAALEKPIRSRRLSELARGKKKVLIVADDNTRPTPIYEFIQTVLAELTVAGVKEEAIEFLMALGTHRPMTPEEIRAKLGADIAKKHTVHNHNWQDSACLEYIGHTEQGVPVWVNKLISRSDLVVGLGSIMPIEVCGFTGGGKILVPGVSGPETIDQMHWTRMAVPSRDILGKADNPIRASIHALAREAGLDFILNVIVNAEGVIVGAVAGDLADAYRAGCRIATQVFGVAIPGEFDIVISDSFPFDQEFWQANKALDTAGQVVKKGGAIVLVSPCYEGFSQTHSDMLEFGYPPIETIRNMVANGRIKHKVVGVHMFQVSSVAVEKAELILVSKGITKEEAEKVGFLWAETPGDAFRRALEIAGKNASVAVLEGASRMLPLVNGRGDSRDGTQG
jgi:nickel-dependent lactate racemase